MEDAIQSEMQVLIILDVNLDVDCRRIIPLKKRVKKYERHDEQSAPILNALNVEECIACGVFLESWKDFSHIATTEGLAIWSVHNCQGFKAVPLALAQGGTAYLPSPFPSIHLISETKTSP